MNIDMHRSTDFEKALISLLYNDNEEVGKHTHKKKKKKRCCVEYSGVK